MKGKPLVLFDGVCGLCDRTVQMLLKEDRSHVLMFAPLQGTTAATIFSKHPEMKMNMESLVFVQDFGGANEKIFTHSTGVLRILDAIGGFWKIVSWLRIIPPPIRDAVYSWIAKNRYQWFGKFDACKVPPAETRARFLP